MSQSDAKKILVIDDETDTTTVLRMLLESYKYQVHAFTEPGKALEEFKAGVYALALIDYKLPQISGFELYEKLLAIDPTLKVCFISAYDMADIAEFRRNHVEANCFLKKPLNPEAVIATVKNHVKAV